MTEQAPRRSRQTETLVDDNGEFADTDERTSFEMVPLDSSFFFSPAVIGATGGIALGMLALLWPNRTDRILARLVGVAVAWVALWVLASAIRHRRRVVATLAVVLPPLAAAAFLLLRPDRSATFLGRLIVAGVIAIAAWRTARPELAGTEHRRWRPTMSAVAMLAVGALLIAFPEDTLGLATTVFASAWIVLSFIVILASLDARQAGSIGYSGALDLVRDWIIARPKSADARRSLYDKILFEGPTTSRRVIRFFTLMAFASVIASMGVITDSTAVVIGAMLIAPLMTPLMAMAMSLVMGWPNRLARSSAIAVGGIVFAIGIGLLLGLVAPGVIDTATNTQISARTNPTILDLITAVAAGAAGAYGLSRPDVSDSLPGVAIAISLVPPLTVVGIAWSQADWESGNGALLLFCTNMVAILVMGGLTFIATGVTPISQAAANQHRVATSLGGVTVLAAIVLGSLFLNGSQAATNLLGQGAVEDTVDQWLDASAAHRVVDVNLDGDTVTAVVVGPSEGLPAPTGLAADLSEELDRDITLDLRHIVEERTVIGGD